jgi:hypothetical protein
MTDAKFFSFWGEQPVIDPSGRWPVTQTTFFHNSSRIPGCFSVPPLFVTKLNFSTVLY